MQTVLHSQKAALSMLVALSLVSTDRIVAQQELATVLPDGVRAVWGLESAHRESTSAREQLCINGLWRWQPAQPDDEVVPDGDWGYFKVPGCWPGITNYMQKDCQTVFTHPHWQDTGLRSVAAAWYQREVTIPAEWKGRRIVLKAEYVNSYAVVYVDGRRVGAIRFPAGEVDLTTTLLPEGRHVVSLLVVPMPLDGVMLSYNDTASAHTVQGTVARRGLCGDVFLVSTPRAARIDDIKIETSVRKGWIRAEVRLDDVAEDLTYVLKAEVLQGDRSVHQFSSKPFRAEHLQDDRITVTEPWQAEKLWDTHTPENMYLLRASLVATDGTVLDEALPVRFGYREFWIDGRDFYLNGTRIYLSSVPLDNAQVGAAWATYDAAAESMRRLQDIGINFVYTHNYGCQPGDHLSFEEILRAADDVGMLVAFSQPHFGHYKWDDPGADDNNGYAQHAAFYVQVAQNHPSVVAYATSHNATGYGEDMNPDMIDGIQAERNEWSTKNVQRAERAAAIIKNLDSSRIVYHHSSGNLGPMHTTNFYANFVPVQEMSDWFEHWATEGVKPVFTCEYCVPMSWDWTMYRGWHQGRREFGSAAVPWEFCVAQWNAQFQGDEAYKISEQEKRNLRWEAKQFREGKVWHRWDYPHVVGSPDLAERYPVFAKYFSDNWPAFRTWGVSANSPWNHGLYWILRDGVNTARQEIAVNWNGLQRPGVSADYIEDRYERVDLAFDREDWMPTVAAQALTRNNGPLLAYIAGKPGAFTAKDHIWHPGEKIEKQLIVINNSRETVTCECQWSLSLPTPVSGNRKITIETGDQHRVPIRFVLPSQQTTGAYELKTDVAFSNGEVQSDSFTVNILPRPAAVHNNARIALFDPSGETGSLLESMGITYRSVDTAVDLSAYDVLVLGKNALTTDGPAPDITRVREGLKVLVFEQTPNVLERRLGFRVATYGLRQVFRRVANHPILAGLEEEHLRDWRGAATIVPPRLEYELSPQFNYAPAVKWCGIPVTRLWRCGNRGNVASVLIEKPACGDFLPILDGGYSLQYSPLLEYREGRGMILFCQMDVTGRTESDPAAETLARNIVDYVVQWRPKQRREAVYLGDPAGAEHLESAGVQLTPYEPGKLDANQVLIVGQGGGRRLASESASIAEWFKSGGHLLALGMDGDEAATFLPRTVATEEKEYIASYFDPLGVDSLLAGVGPADVLNPDPRVLPLISGEAAVGSGVLGMMKDANVVFCQLPPYDFDTKQLNLKRAFRRTSFLLTRLLGNMGVAGSTPLLDHFPNPVGSSTGTSVVQNGDFNADTDGDGMPDEWLITPSDAGKRVKEETPMSANAWSLLLANPPKEGDGQSGVMLAQHDVSVEKDQWYRISFKARSERPLAKSVAVTITDMKNWRSFFEYQRFTPGTKWEPFSFQVQSNGTADGQTRFQIWFDGPGEVRLSDVRVEPIRDPTHGRWLEGLYLDVPEEWDDPYRFFRW